MERDDEEDGIFNDATAAAKGEFTVVAGTLVLKNPGPPPGTWMGSPPLLPIPPQLPCNERIFMEGDAAAAAAATDAVT